MKRYAELTGNSKKQRIKSLCDNILGPGQSGAVLGGQGNWVERIVASQDRGLKPRLAWLARSINRELLPWLDKNGEFEFIFVGLNAKSDQERTSLSKEQVSVFKTPAEAREEHGLPPLKIDFDKDLDPTQIPLNQQFIMLVQSIKQNRDQQKEQEQQDQGQDDQLDNKENAANNDNSDNGDESWQSFMSSNTNQQQNNEDNAMW